MSADESEQRTRAQVWEAIRRLSDVELERIQQLILRSRSSSSLAPNETTSPRKDAERIPLMLVEASGVSNQSKQAGEKIRDDDGGAAKEDNQADNDAAHADDAKAAARTKSRVTQWSPSDLIHAFLGHLHQVVHSQQVASASATGTVTAGGASNDSTAATKKADEKNSAQRGAKSSTGSSSKSSPFALQNKDFPSLLSVPAPAMTKIASALHKPNVKAAKRRITTTLLSDQNMITRPVLNAVAFPPLGGGGNSGNANPDVSTRAQSNNPWARRELLERRMMSSVEPGGATSVPESPSTQSPVLTKSHVPLVNSDKSAETRDSSAAKAQQVKKLFDDSPPGGPKRVQPFPMASSQLPDPNAAICHSPVVTTPLKSNSVQQPPSVLLCVKSKRPRRHSLLLSATGNEADVLLSNSTTPGTTLFEGEANGGALQTKTHTADDFSANTQAAKFYGFLISKRLAGSTCAELQLLISLLFRSNCAGASSPISPASIPGLEASPAAACCASLNEFCWRSHCLKFASIVLNGIEHILGSLGSELLLLLTNALADADICADMLERLQQLAQRREELRVEESARIGCKLPVETKASAVRDFALPFCEEMDSRLHYRSPTESVMYSNREKVRDSFLDLLRQFQKQQHSLLGIESANVAASAIENANNLLAEVAPENRWWFAKFFVMELIQVGSNPFGESDKDLVLKIMEDKLVVKNPDRLRKLHRRFSSQKQSTKAPNTTTPAITNPAATGTNPSHNSNNNHSNKNQFGTSFFGGSNNSKSSSRSGKSDRNESSNNSSSNNNSGSSRAPPSFSSNGNSGAISATFETTRRYFAENQQFFFHFMHSCDSYEFSQLVKYQLESQFQSIWKENANADARKSFTEVVLKLKVVAKFLGYLRFSPHWHNSSSLVQLSKQNPAFKAAKKEAVWTLENAESVGLDVKLILEQSIVESKISKCVPWLCDYLTMLSLDKLSLATTYFKQLLVLMERVYHSPRLDALSETGLYISMQIERVFHVLDFDVAGCLDDVQFKSSKLQPPASLLLVLEETEPPMQDGEDNLPFLHSQVFVQSCVNELEDLRGFIQTRAKPSHRVTKRPASGFVAGSGVSQSIPIRKLRPLQVVTAEEHNDDLLAKVDAASAAAQSSSASLLSDEDKLSESIFKIHPNLRKVVEFVVEVVATNICEYVLQQIVTPSADAFISSCVSESRLNLRERGGSSPVNAAELESTTIVFLQLLENRTTRTIHESVAESLAEASRVCEAKVRASIPHLIPPSCHPTLAKSVTLVALNRTRGVVKNLIPKSSRSEFLKRVAFRKKVILKETASKSAAQASAAAAILSASTVAEEDNVVRTLSTMFDEHAGVENSNQDDLLFALKQASAQIFKLSSTRRSKATPDEWAKLHTSLSRHLRLFISSLEELESESRGAEDACPEDDVDDGEEATRRKRRKIHELSVWDATWRVFISCLRVVTGLTYNVVEWTGSEASSVEKRPESSTNALEKTVSGFVDNFVALLTLVLVGSQEAPSSQANKEKKKTEGSGDEVEARRLVGLVRVVTDCLLAKPPSLKLDNLEQQDPSGLVQRLVLAPRVRVLNVMALFGASPDFGGIALTSLSKESLLSRQRRHSNQKSEIQVEDGLCEQLRLPRRGLIRVYQICIDKFAYINHVYKLSFSKSAS